MHTTAGNLSGRPPTTSDRGGQTGDADADYQSHRIFGKFSSGNIREQLYRSGRAVLVPVVAGSATSSSWSRSFRDCVEVLRVTGIPTVNCSTLGHKFDKPLTLRSNVLDNNYIGGVNLSS